MATTKGCWSRSASPARTPTSPLMFIGEDGLVSGDEAFVFHNHPPLRKAAACSANTPPAHRPLNEPHCT